MSHNFLYHYRLIFVLVISLLFICGCTSATATPLSEIHTPSPAPTTSSTEPPSPIQEPNSTIQSILIAHEASVTVFQDETNETNLSSGESINLPSSERIKLDKAGRGVLLFGDRYEIELFGGAEIQLDEAKLESGGSTFVRFKQIAGHSHIMLDDRAIARLTLETSDSTIRTLEQGTEFTVCYAPEKVTCIVVQEGSIEVTSENEKREYKKGEATYYKPGQPPQPPICVVDDSFNDWLARKWSPGETEALGALVSNWPQEPCAAPIAEVPAITPTEISEPTITPDPTAEALPVKITDAFSVSMVLVPAGPFEMGGLVDEGMAECQKQRDDCMRSNFEDEEPVHTVILDNYYMDQYEVTNALYADCVSARVCELPSESDSYRRKSYYDNPEYSDYPVIYVSWYDAQNYCQWRGTRLPTEAEWEKAARGGLEGALYPWGDEAPQCDMNAINGAKFDDREGCRNTDTESVGSYSANGYGLYDMAGNVWEWTADWYAADYYATSPANNPEGPEDGSHRVVRGASWNLVGYNLRVASRHSFDPASDAKNNFGFRCAKSP
jgi:formylglycine-generating enzyme required for sulfatase activity